jgi:hypothetical protein
MNKVTFVCWPKPFKDKAEYYPFQKNALLSWKNLSITKNIIVIGNEDGNAEFCKEHGFIFEPEVGEVNQFGTPYVKSILDQCYKYCNVGDPICYINSDILLFEDFSTICEWFFESELSSKNYLCVGQRWDWKNPREIDFSNSEWENSVRGEIYNNGELLPPYAIDYFLHKAHSYPTGNMPPLAMGRLHWDRWLVGYAIRNFGSVIDFTNLTHCIHHETSYMLNGQKIDKTKHTLSEECLANCRMDSDYGMNINQSSHIATMYDDKIQFIKRY